MTKKSIKESNKVKNPIFNAFAKAGKKIERPLKIAGTAIVLGGMTLTPITYVSCENDTTSPQSDWGSQTFHMGPISVVVEGHIGSLGGTVFWNNLQTILTVKGEGGGQQIWLLFNQKELTV
ncbi:MAG: hypothetical protein LBG10_08240 [Treponema sp.]|jgi:hypothetical protein|nr:hypothetical protein [Treponema sp.]